MPDDLAIKAARLLEEHAGFTQQVASAAAVTGVGEVAGLFTGAVGAAMNTAGTFLRAGDAIVVDHNVDLAGRTIVGGAASTLVEIIPGSEVAAKHTELGRKLEAKLHRTGDAENMPLAEVVRQRAMEAVGDGHTTVTGTLDLPGKSMPPSGAGRTPAVDQTPVDRGNSIG